MAERQPTIEELREDWRKERLRAERAEAEVTRLATSLSVSESLLLELQALCLSLREALQGTLDEYVSTANSGDCGFWNCEEEEHVIASRAALASPDLTSLVAQRRRERAVVQAAIEWRGDVPLARINRTSWGEEPMPKVDNLIAALAALQEGQ